MAISTVPVTGSYVPPDGSTIVGGKLIFALSGPDTEGSTVVQGETIAELDGDSLPVGFELWRNTAGVRGTYFKVRARVYVEHVVGATTVQTQRSYEVGNVQTGEAASYTLTELLNNPVPDEPSWNLNVQTATIGELLAEVRPEHFGAVGDGATDDTDALQDMFDASLSLQVPWRMTGTYAVAGALTCYTSGSGAGAEIIVPMSGQTEPFAIAPDPADVPGSSDAALLSAWNAIVAAGSALKDATTFSTLAPWVNKTVKLFSATPYINRTNGNPSEHLLTFKIVDEKGRIWPPLPYDVQSSVVFSSALPVPIRPWIDVRLPHIPFSAGTGTRITRAVANRRSNVRVFVDIENTTATEVQVGFLHDAGACDCVLAGSVRGMNENATNYGVQQAGAALFMDGVTISDCRRSFDSQQGNWTRAVNSYFWDGFGAHVGFNAKIVNCTCSNDGTSEAPIFWSAGGIDAIGCTLISETAYMVRTREDFPDNNAPIRIIDCDCIFNATGQTELFLISHGFTAMTAGTYNPGKPISAAPQIVHRGGSVVIKDPSFTGALKIWALDGNPSISSQTFTLPEYMEFSGTHWDTGAAVIQHSSTRRVITAGRTITKISGVPNLKVYAGTATDVGVQTSDRHRYDVQTEGDLILQVDGSALERFRGEFEGTYTQLDAVGTIALAGDEQIWVRTKATVWYRNHYITNNGVVSFVPGQAFSSFRLQEANGSAAAAWADIIVDAAGSYGVTIQASGNGTWARSSAVLGGSTGSVGAITVSVNSGRIYIENRSGNPKAFRVLGGMA